MPRYTVVQFYPDTIADERVNIGVIVFGDGTLRQRWLTDWRRVEQFAGEDVSFLQELIAKVACWDERQLKRAVENWGNMIRFRTPYGGIEPPDVMLEAVAQSYLRGPSGPPPVSKPPTLTTLLPENCAPPVEQTV